MSEKRFMNVKEAADYLECGELKIRKLMKERKLSFLQDGHKHRIRIPIAALVAYEKAFTTNGVA